MLEEGSEREEMRHEDDDEWVQLAMEKGILGVD